MVKICSHQTYMKNLASWRLSVGAVWMNYGFQLTGMKLKSPVMSLK